VKLFKGVHGLDTRVFRWMTHQSQNLKVFSGSANRALSELVARYIGCSLGKAEVSHFPDGETKVQILENVRGADVFVIQPTCPPVNDNLMELLLIMDALRRSSVARITAVLPYFGYARQDRKSAPNQPITAKLVAGLITAAGPHRILTLDLHASQIQGFFNLPVDNLYADPVLMAYIRMIQEQSPTPVVIVASHAGGAKRARRVARKLDLSFAMVDKRRLPGTNEYQAMNVVGDITPTAVIVDDMIDTATSVLKAAEALQEKGAENIYVCATHGVLSKNAIDVINSGPFKEVVITNSISHPEIQQESKKIVVLSVANLLGEAIRRIHNEESVSSLFDVGSKR